MRSEMVFRASQQIGADRCRSKLCQTAAKVTRRLHVPFYSAQDTITGALERIAFGLEKSAPELPKDVAPLELALILPPCQADP